LESAKKNNIKTIEEVQHIISSMAPDETNELHSIISKIKKAKENLYETISNISKTNVPGICSGLINNLDKIQKITDSHHSDTQNPQSPKNEALQIEEPINLLENRDIIYQQINTLARKLEEIEKHSPSSYLLNLVFSWKNKTLLEIMNGLKTGISESHQLLKFLIS
jgi:hypothetical protein